MDPDTMLELCVAAFRRGDSDAARHLLGAWERDVMDAQYRCPPDRLAVKDALWTAVAVRLAAPKEEGE